MQKAVNRQIAKPRLNLTPTIDDEWRSAQETTPYRKMQLQGFRAEMRPRDAHTAERGLAVCRDRS